MSAHDLMNRLSLAFSNGPGEESNAAFSAALDAFAAAESELARLREQLHRSATVCPKDGCMLWRGHAEEHATAERVSAALKSESELARLTGERNDAISNRIDVRREFSDLARGLGALTLPRPMMEGETAVGYWLDRVETARRLTIEAASQAEQRAAQAETACAAMREALVDLDREAANCGCDDGAENHHNCPYGFVSRALRLDTGTALASRMAVLEEVAGVARAAVTPSVCAVDGSATVGTAIKKLRTLADALAKLDALTKGA